MNGHFCHVLSLYPMFSGYFYLGVVHEELLGQHVPAGVRVKVGVFVQQPGDDVNMDCRVEVLQLLQT